MKRILFSLVAIVVLLFGSIGVVKAQGSYDCAWIGIPSLGTCQVSGAACDSGYIVPPGNPCGTLNYINCTNVSSLQCITSAGSSTTTVNGPALTNCGGGKGIETAIGCIPIDSEQGLATFFLGWGMGLGGGIALIMIVISTFMIMTSAGDPRKLQVGKDLLTSAISGLILLVFSAYILRVIGVDLLGIF